MSRAGIKRKVRVSAKAQQAGLDLAGERAEGDVQSPASRPPVSAGKSLPRAVVRSVMTLFCKLYPEIEREKMHGLGGAPRKGRLHDIAASYLLQLPDAKLWNLSSPACKKKLGTYLRNADSKGRSYAAQQRDTANKCMVAVERAYDFWDIPEVQNHYLTSHEHRQSARQSSEVVQIEDSPVDNLADIAPVISIADTTTVGDHAEEQVAGAAAMIKRRTSLGGAVHALESTLTPLVAALHSRFSSGPPRTALTLDMRADVFNWLDDQYYGDCKAELMAWVAGGCSKGEQVTFTVWAMTRAEKDVHTIAAQLYEYLAAWDEV